MRLRLYATILPRGHWVVLCRSNESGISVVSSRLMKESVVTSSAIACAAVGFVLGSAFFDAEYASPAAHATQWMLVTACFSAAFIVGLISEYLLKKFRTPSPPPQTGTGIQNFRRSIEHRFKGDRTDVEYQRAENGVVVLVAIASTVVMLFLIGIWAIVAVVIVLSMINAADLYLALRSTDGSASGKIGRALFSGIFYGIFFGDMLSIL